jgi:hypothetical protein
MLYDDDPAMPLHDDITRADRKLVDVGRIPKKAKRRIAELQQNPDWEPEDIFDQMRREGYGISLDAIIAAMR